MESHDKGQASGMTDEGTAAIEPDAAGDAAAGNELESPDAPRGSETSQEADYGGDGVDAGEVGQDEEPSPEESRDSPDESLENELAEARRAAQDNLDRALRAQAELENVRRRLERDLERAHKFALERFVSELLPVKDSLELGLDAAGAKTATTTSIAEGVVLTLRMFEQVFEKFGITTVDPAGEAFDPAFHQAMTMQECETADSGTVLTVVQKGYVLNERLVRPAMVIVAK